MLSSIPASLQAVFWPLAGAVLVVALGRFLPHWLGRFLALSAAVASFVALVALRGEAAGGFQATWEPFTFLRTSPALQPTPLGRLTGLVLAGWSAIAALGIRGSQHPRTTWHGLNLVLLAGGVLTSLSVNLLTLALGGALLDMGLLAVATSPAGAAGPSRRVSDRLGLPGLLSTGLLLLAALRLDTDTGTLSLLAPGLSSEVAALIGLAGLFRLAVLLLPRAPSAPERAASLLVAMVAGSYLVALAQSLGPEPAGAPWFLAVGAVALVAGGWRAWSAGVLRSGPGEWSEAWSALAIQQAGATVVALLLFPSAAPWPVAAFVLALGQLVLWWDASQEGEPGAAAAWLAWSGRQGSLLARRVRALVRRLADRSRLHAPRQAGVDAIEAGPWPVAAGPRHRWRRLRSSWLAQRGAAVLPALALASLAGAPFTAGSVVRWHLYADLLADARALLLVLHWCSDLLLAAGLVLALRSLLRTAEVPRPRWFAVAAMVLLALASLVLWLAPRLPALRAEVPSLPSARVSAWGVGLLFVLPWVVGAWLARISSWLARGQGRLQHFASLDRAIRPVEWLGGKLAMGVYWLGNVGEGEGWWGWVLAVLSLGALYLLVR